MKPAIDKGRMECLDFLRGIAALGVCLYHCCFADTIMPHKAQLASLAQFGDKGVQVFFILSGFVIPYSLSRQSYTLTSAGRFLLRRLLRIQPAYIVAVALSVLVFGFLLKRPGFYDFGDLAANIVYFVPFVDSPWFLNVSWTLGVEAQFYILLSVSYPLLVSNSNFVRRLAFACFVLLCFTSKILPAAINPWYVLPTWTPFFATGLLLFLFHLRKISRKEFFITSTCMVALLFFEYTKLLTLVTLLTGFLILWLPSEKKLIGHFLGKISYSLYLVHLPIIILLAELIKPFGIIDRFPNCSVILLALSSIAASIPFYHFLEKPSVGWAKKLGKQRTK